MSKLVNFRDLGGIPTTTGKTIRPHRLLRAGEMSHLPESDVTMLVEEYGLKNIVDMRTDNERDENPDTEMPGVTNYHFDYFGADGIMKNAPSMEQFFESVGEGESADEFLFEAYKDIAFTETGKTGLKNFLNVILNEKEGATLWHCTAGKDRTGISAAFLLAILDVSYEEIVKDFLLTNEMRKPVNDAIIAEAVAKGLPEDKVALIRPMLNVSKKNLDQLFDLIKERYGTIDHYLEKELGITSEVKARLIERYTF